jgi:hypothetical protein
MQKADPKAGLVFVVSGDEVRSDCRNLARDTELSF